MNEDDGDFAAGLSTEAAQHLVCNHRLCRANADPSRRAGPRRRRYRSRMTISAPGSSTRPWPPKRSPPNRRYETEGEAKQFGRRSSRSRKPRKPRTRKAKSQGRGRRGRGRSPVAAPSQESRRRRRTRRARRPTTSPSTWAGPSAALVRDDEPEIAAVLRGFWIASTRTRPNDRFAAANETARRRRDGLRRRTGERPRRPKRRPEPKHTRPKASGIPPGSRAGDGDRAGRGFNDDFEDARPVPPARSRRPGPGTARPTGVIEAIAVIAATEGIVRSRDRGPVAQAGRAASRAGARPRSAEADDPGDLQARPGSHRPGHQGGGSAPRGRRSAPTSASPAATSC